jgi:hypothetical protein
VRSSMQIAKYPAERLRRGRLGKLVDQMFYSAQWPSAFIALPQCSTV